VKGKEIVNVRHTEPFRAIFGIGKGRVSNRTLLVELAGHYQKRLPSLRALANKATA
jgi:hypothetical protein